jgi:hypothetical protein
MAESTRQVAGWPDVLCVTLLYLADAAIRRSTCPVQQGTTHGFQFDEFDVATDFQL